MSMINLRPDRWGKVSKEGYFIPVRCPECRSRKTVLAKYANGEKYIECEGCNQVICKAKEKNNYFLIIKGKDYWSNDLGWTEYKSLATKFNYLETKLFRYLPFGGKWIKERS